MAQTRSKRVQLGLTWQTRFCFADLPAYLKKPRLPRHVWLSVAHFRLGRAHLWVDAGTRFHSDSLRGPLLYHMSICAQFGKRAVEDASIT
jgi:hypothetical protein